MQYTERLSEIRSYFSNGDFHVGYRRLLDAVIETGNFDTFEKTLEFCDWYDVNTERTEASLTELESRVNQLLEIISNTESGRTISYEQPLLKAENLSKKYSNGPFSLSPIDISLFPGQIIGLVGENGNGKTTLLRLLFGELSPNSGKLSYNLHKSSSSSDFYSIKTRLAFIPQRPDPWYGSLMDNLRFTATHYGYKGRENMLWTEIICARMGLRAFRTFNWNRISSGYKMRFELARTLIKKPEIMLLDEPLANLDILAQQVILEDLRFLAQSPVMPLGIILSSQQLYEVEKVSDEVVFLKQGKPKYQQIRQSAEQVAQALPLILELETKAGREELTAVFARLPLLQISFNGGVYIAYFAEGTDSRDVIRRIADSGTPVKYFRDISSSSRRFFEA